MALPTREQVIASCKIDYNKLQGKTNYILWPGDNGSPLFYIKYGPGITMAEAINQRYFFDKLKGIPSIRIAQVFEAFQADAWTYIVMEYIRSSGFASRNQIADAVALLLGVDPPANAKPGPVGGGLMHHLLFKDRTASKVFSSNADLKTAIYQRLKLHPKARTFSLITFASDDLAMYYSDLFRENFPIDEHGHTCVVDFHEAGIAPKDFMSLALNDFPILAKAVKAKIPWDWDLEPSNLPSLCIARYMFAIGCR